MANTAGGWILYGIDETELPDGSTVASSIWPLTDASIETKLADVFYSTIHPRPRFRTQRIPVNNNTGFVLIVEAYQAYSSDLHMVTGFKENRFYRRGEKRTVLMTEPEVREAYMRIAAAHRALDASIEEAISSELKLVPRAQESVLVVPWFGHHDLVNPRQLGESFAGELTGNVRPTRSWCSRFSDLRPFSGGYRYYFPADQPLQECTRYISIRRDGLVHLAEAPVTRPGDNLGHISLQQSATTMITAILAAQYVLDRVGYWGPIRVIHRLNVEVPFFLKDPTRDENHDFLTDKKPVEPGEYRHIVPEANLNEQAASIRLLLRELLDQVFQTSGEFSCPWFEPSGNLKPDMDKFLPQIFCQHLVD